MFQIQKYSYELLAVLVAAYGDKYEAAKARAEEIVADTQTRLTKLAKSVLEGKIAVSDLPQYAEDEFSIFKVQLLEAAIIGESAIQEIVNDGIAKVTAIITDLSQPK